ncbi:hypothetical protein HBN54_003401 [Hymenobacter sp. 1B]|uniref:Cbb3-type cytochrome oxidase assembly protein CcoS n=1 Tax=Hymenobacter artigasi TaxID=2719616 RepID=A0ABX1HP82_9BACT|nr:hypothetical protein [Hymenobacter artigasi]
MDNADIFLFTLLVVPAFIVFAFLTIREFAHAGESDFKPDSDKRLK